MSAWMSPRHEHSTFMPASCLEVVFASISGSLSILLLLRLEAAVWQMPRQSFRPYGIVTTHYRFREEIFDGRIVVTQIWLDNCNMIPIHNTL
jgi:hypothetical protein